MFDAQLFLQCHSVPHREHSLTYKKKHFLQPQLVPQENSLTNEDQSWRGIINARGPSCPVSVIFVL